MEWTASASDGALKAMTDAIAMRPLSGLRAYETTPAPTIQQHRVFENKNLLAPRGHGVAGGVELAVRFRNLSSQSLKRFSLPD